MLRLAPACGMVLLLAAPGHAQHEGHGPEEHGAPPALLGPFTIGREASGTSWVPEASPHRALHARHGPWDLMLHGYAQVVADRQGGGRGEADLFANQMLMATATRLLGPGRLGLRAMMTAEPGSIGREGYPLLLQTGETADGVTELIDRQHPHDLFMELAGTFSVSRRDRSAFLYAGLPGEPALGPPVYMHRFSGESFPEAPIGHHWLDSSHITFGVLTGGLIRGAGKLEASAFRGREPDQHRWDFENPKLDSHAFRLSWNPAPPWALQVSRGRLIGPEQLKPDVDMDRTTASAIHHHSAGGVEWQTTLAWGQNDLRPGPVLDAWLLESALELRDRHAVLARVERTEKDELFAEGQPRHGRVFIVGKLGLGYVWEGWQSGPVRWGIGALGTVSFVPGAIRDVYGDAPVSGMGFILARLR